MSKLLLLALSLSSVFARAEIMPLNLFKWGGAVFSGRYHFQHVMNEHPVVRPRRVPLLDLHPCEGEGPCVILSGVKKNLEPTPADLMHGRVQVVGTSKERGYTGLYARVRFGSWADSEPDYLLVWAAVRERSRRVKILGYTVQRDDDPGIESEAVSRVRNVPLYKFLTTRNALEVEVARELVERSVFCLRHPAEPSDILRDEVVPLETADLLDDASHVRLAELNAIASVIGADRGPTKCDSPLTDQIDIVLNEVRASVQGFVSLPPVAVTKELPVPAPTPAPTPIAPESKPAAPAPAPTVTIPTPSPAPPVQGVPGLSPAPTS